MSKWEKVKLGEVATIQGGYAFKSDQFIKNEVPIIRIGNLDGENVVLDYNICYPYDFWERYDAYRIKKGDILIAMSGATVGKVGRYAHSEPALLNQRVGMLRVNVKIIFPDYVYWYVKSGLFYKQIQQLSIGCAQPNISARQIEDIYVPLPPYEVQKHVAQTLGTAAELLAMRRQQLAELDNLIKSVFCDMFGDPVSNEMGWNKYFLSDVFDIIDGDRGGNYPKQEDFSEEGYCLFLNTGNVTKEGFSFESVKFISKEKDHQLRKGRLERGDIVLTTRGTVGNIAYYNDAVPYDVVRINSGMVILRKKDRSISQEFFCELFKSKEMVREITSFMSGTAQPQLPISNMKKIMIILPPIELQCQFVQTLTKIEEQKALVKKAIDETQHLLDSLMNQYFD